MLGTGVKKMERTLFLFSETNTHSQAGLENIQQSGQSFYSDSNHGNSGPGQPGMFGGVGEGIIGGNIWSGLEVGV